MSHLPLDARAILDYLNELGYRNISGEQLKEFMKDLRKLIKYEETLGIKANQDNYFENLFKRTTASFRAKHGKENEGCQRVVELKSKNGREKHVLRPLSHFEQQHQHQQQTNSSGDAMATKYGPNHASHALQPPKLSVRDGENLLHKRAWHAGDRIPFRECNNVRRSQQSADGMTNNHAPIISKKGFSTRDAQQSTKRGGGQAAGVGRNYDVRAVKGAKPHTDAMTRDENSQRNQLGATSKETTNRTGRTRVRTPSQERGDTGRSPSGGSYTTARSKGVIIPKHCTATRRRRPLSTDPVALYHYYQNEWNHFREQIPGESTHAELRWMVRARLMDAN